MSQVITVPIAISAVDVDRRTFTGLASSWGLAARNGQKEQMPLNAEPRLQRGALARTLDHWQKSSRPRRIALFERELRVGQLQSATETAEGLLVTFVLERFAVTLLPRIKDSRRALAHLAISYEPIRHDGAGRFYEVRLERFGIAVESVIAPDDPARVALDSKLDALKQRAFAP